MKQRGKGIALDPLTPRTPALWIFAPSGVGKSSMAGELGEHAFHCADQNAMATAGATYGMPVQGANTTCVEETIQVFEKWGTYPVEQRPWAIHVDDMSAQLKVTKRNKERNNTGWKLWQAIAAEAMNLLNVRRQTGIALIVGSWDRDPDYAARKLGGPKVPTSELQVELPALFDALLHGVRGPYGVFDRAIDNTDPAWLAKCRWNVVIGDAPVPMNLTAILEGQCAAAEAGGVPWPRPVPWPKVVAPHQQEARHLVEQLTSMDVGDPVIFTAQDANWLIQARHHFHTTRGMSRQHALWLSRYIGGRAWLRRLEERRWNTGL